MKIAQPERLTPSVEQEQAIAQILASPTRSALNASSMGVGKTLQAVEVALRLPDVRTVLITCPLNVKYHWAETVERQTQGTKAVRFIDRTVRGQKAWGDLVAGHAGFYVIGRELFRRMPWAEVGHVDLVVHDESAVLSNRKNKSHKVALDLRKRSGFTICQSATWFGSNFGNAWGVGRILFPKQTPESYWAWVYQYARMVPDRFDPTGQKIVGEREPGAFARVMPCYINLQAKASEPPLLQEIRVDLTAVQRRAYDAMEKRGVVWLRDNPLVASVPGTIHARLRQLTLGELVVRETGEIDPKTGLPIEEVDFAADGRSAKFDALQEMLADMPDEQVLIGTDSAKFARWVAARLPGAYAWTGEASPTDRETAKDLFVRGEIRYIVATQASIAEGVNSLQFASHIIIELSQNYDPSMNSQFVGRLHRSGQSRRVLVYRLVATRTRDDVQHEGLLDKALRMRQSMLKDAVA